MFESVPFQLFLAVILGAVIGLERESSGQGDRPGSAGGIRTFALVCLLGALAGALYQEHLTIFIILAAVFSLLLISYYIMGSYLTKHLGVTNEISMLYTFLIGLLVTLNFFPLQWVIALTVVLILILAFKDKTRKLMGEVSRHELESFISYAIIALVVLPFLPNIGYTVSQIPLLSSLLASYDIDLGRFATLEIINPRKIWFIVVLVTGIDVFGYLLGKFVGHERSATMTSFVAGFISSTSATQSLAQKSKRVRGVNYLVGAALLANAASFFQIFLLVGPLNGEWLVALTPTVFLLIFSALLMSALFLRDKKSGNGENEIGPEEKKIFSLVPAVKFAVLIISVKLVTKISLIVFGQSGFLVSSIIASFAGLDAIVINLADLAGKGITFEFALLTLIMVNATNLLSKSVYAFIQGSRPFAFRFFVSVILIIAASVSGFLFTF